MPITHYKIDMYNVDYTCDKCGKGVMRPLRDGIQMVDQTKGIPHKCNNDMCLHVDMLKINYPFQMAVKEGDEVKLADDEENPEADA